nr:pyridoxal phosphate-dependent aminotransferase [Komagataeibacter sucrofermentans]
MLSEELKKADRLSHIGVSEILTITQRAVAMRAAGRPMIILGAGEPDFDTPDNIKEAACQAIARGETGYTALGGTPRFREAIRHKYQHENGLTFDLAEIMGATGAKQVIYNAMAATLDEGDEVLVPAPYWTSYIDIIRFCGGVPVCIPTQEENGFCLTPAQLERHITPRTRWLFLNSPSNPTGSAYTEAALGELAAILRRNPAVNVLSDDIYEHIAYDGFVPRNILQVAPDLRGQVLLVNGVSKAYAMTGWRIGFAAGPRAMIDAMLVVQSQTTSCPCSISQAATVEALTGPQDSVRTCVQAFSQRRDLVVDSLNAIDGIHCLRPKGAFYAFASCRDLIGRRTPHGQVIASDSDFMAYLMAHDVAVVPGSCFGTEGYFRISYAASAENLQTAMARIQSACAQLAQP